MGSVSNLYTRIFMNETASSVTIEGPSIIPDGSVLNVASITNNLGADRLLVDEGGQLVTSNNVNATVRKTITPYAEEHGTDNYYLISTPVDGQDPTEANMTDGAFDLYSFDQTQQGEEWQNYEANAFALQSGKGYLYANDYGGNIVMAGQMKGAADYVTITHVSDKNLAGWNLIGNPYPCNVTIGKPYYRLAEGGAASARWTLPMRGEREDAGLSRAFAFAGRREEPLPQLLARPVHAFRLRALALPWLAVRPRRGEVPHWPAPRRLRALRRAVHDAGEQLHAAARRRRSGEGVPDVDGAPGRGPGSHGYDRPLRRHQSARGAPASAAVCGGVCGLLRRALADEGT